MRWLLGLGLLLAATQGLARPVPAAKRLQQARDAFIRGKHQEALALTDQVLQQKTLATAERVTAHELQAFVLLVMGLFPQAEKAYREVLRLDPEHRLDPVTMSPELYSFFSKVHEEVDRERAAPPVP